MDDSDSPVDMASRVEAVGRESALMHNSRSTYVVAVHQPWYVASRAVLCIPQELCDESLEVFRQRHSSHGIPLVMLYSIVFQCLEALIDLQKAGIVHNDIKPANIMLVWDYALDAGLPRVKLADFGLASPSCEIVNLEEPIAVGTTCFMAPECYTLDGRSAPHARDLWSMGCLFHVLLTNHYPFPGASTEEVRARSTAGSVTSLSHLSSLGPTRTFLYNLTRTMFTPDPVARPTAAQLRRTILSQTAIMPPPVLAPAQLPTYRRIVVCPTQLPIHTCTHFISQRLYTNPHSLLPGTDNVFVLSSTISRSLVFPRSLAFNPSSFSAGEHMSSDSLTFLQHRRREGGRTQLGRGLPSPQHMMPQLEATANLLWHHVASPFHGYCAATFRGHPTLPNYEQFSGHPCDRVMCQSATPPLNLAQPRQRRSFTLDNGASPVSTPHTPALNNPKIHKPLINKRSVG